MDLSSVILPPLEIRNVIDKTSNFVAKNGPAFEERIYDKERYNPKFGFLHPNDPYHRYYQIKIEDIKNGTDQLSQLLSSAVAAIPPTEQPDQTPKEPKPFEFYIPHPAIPPLDLDVIKCTALYVARNGRQFLSVLCGREQKNVQFDFLKPSNILFGYFSKLVEMYTKIMQFSTEITSKLDLYSDRDRLLDSLLERQKYVEYKRTVEQREVFQRQQQLQPVNWQEFVIVENLELSSLDDKSTFNLPVTLNDLKSTSLKEKIQTFALSEKSANSNPYAPLASSSISEGKIKELPCDFNLKSSTISMEKCPICKKSFPSSEIESHMKLELANKMLIEKNEDHVEIIPLPDSIGMNLSNFINQAVKLKTDNSTESNLKDKVIWDGMSTSVNATAKAAQIQSNRMYQEEMNDIAIPESCANVNLECDPSVISSMNPYPNLAICPMGPVPNLAICPMCPISSYHNTQNAQIETLPLDLTRPNLQNYQIPSYSNANACLIPLQTDNYNNPLVQSSSINFASNIPTDSSVAAGYHVLHRREDENEEKKFKSFEQELIPAEKFISLHPEPVTISINLPDNSDLIAKSNLPDNIITLQCSLQETINDVKVKVQNITGVPVSKQRLFLSNLPPLKNQLSLAYYNVMDKTCISLSFRERGGKKN